MYGSILTHAQQAWKRAAKFATDHDTALSRGAGLILGASALVETGNVAQHLLMTPLQLDELVKSFASHGLSIIDRSSMFMCGMASLFVAFQKHDETRALQRAGVTGPEPMIKFAKMFGYGVSGMLGLGFGFFGMDMLPQPKIPAADLPLIFEHFYTAVHTALAATAFSASYQLLTRPTAPVAQPRSIGFHV